MGQAASTAAPDLPGTFLLYHSYNDVLNEKIRFDAVVQATDVSVQDQTSSPITINPLGEETDNISILVPWYMENATDDSVEKFLQDWATFYQNWNFFYNSGITESSFWLSAFDALPDGAEWNWLMWYEQAYMILAQRAQKLWTNISLPVGPSPPSQPGASLSCMFPSLDPVQCATATSVVWVLGAAAFIYLLGPAIAGASEFFGRVESHA